jgi:hypothetical protein
MRALLMGALAVATSTAAPVWAVAEEPAHSTTPAPPPSDGSPSADVLQLGTTVMGTPSGMVPSLLRSDPRFGKLNADGRAWLLNYLQAQEDRRVLGFCLNLSLGFGIGSFAQGDWLWGIVGLGTQLGAIPGAIVANRFAKDAEAAQQGGDGWFEVEYAMIALFLASHLLCAIFPWLFKGERYNAVASFFESRAAWLPVFTPLAVAPSSPNVEAIRALARR